MSEWVTVATVGEIAANAYRVFDVDGTHIALFNLDGQYYAIEDMCTHDAGQLSGGAVEDGNIICPRHGAKFCIRTGAALTAPAYEPTPTFPVRIENEQIQIRDTRWD